MLQNETNIGCRKRFSKPLNCRTKSAMQQSHVSRTAILYRTKQSWHLPNLQSSTAGTKLKSSPYNPTHLQCLSVRDIIQRHKLSLLLSLTTKPCNDNSKRPASIHPRIRHSAGSVHHASSMLGPVNGGTLGRMPLKVGPRYTPYGDPSKHEQFEWKSSMHAAADTCAHPVS